MQSEEVVVAAAKESDKAGCGGAGGGPGQNGADGGE